MLQANLDLVNSLRLVRQLGFHFWRHNLDVHPLDAYVSFLGSHKSTASSLAPNSRFMKALAIHGYSRDKLPYKAPFQPWGSYFALTTTAIVTFFKGYDSFIPFKADAFITSYIAIPVFFILWAGYKFYFKTRIIPLDRIDLVSGKREIDEEEEQFLAEQAKLGPQPWWRRMWDSL